MINEKIIIYFEIDFPHEKYQKDYNTLLPLATDENNHYGGNVYNTIKSIPRLRKLLHLHYYQSNTLYFCLFSNQFENLNINFRIPVSNKVLITIRRYLLCIIGSFWNYAAKLVIIYELLLLLFFLSCFQLSVCKVYTAIK